MNPDRENHFGRRVADLEMLWNFEYILFFITLFVSIVCFSGILHYVVDKFVVDASSNSFWISDWQNALLRNYVAGLVVSFPIFAGLFLMIEKQALDNPLVHGVHARKVLTYLILLISFVVIMGYLIALIGSFLEGSVSNNSLAHAVVTLFIVGSTLFYFFADLRRTIKPHA